MPQIDINAPRQGIAQSAHVGFGDVRNMDIDTIPGIARLNNILVKESAEVVDAQVNWIVQNPLNTSEFFALDANGSLYTSTDGGDTWSEVSDRAGSGQGLIIFKDYLIIAEDTTLDIYGPLASSPTFDDNWQTIDSDTLWHPMVVSKNDGIVYGGAGRYVFSIEEVAGQTFNPDTAATFTFKQQALDLPANYKIKSIEELGNNLMLGTWQGTNIYDIRVGDIFPWDRSSPSFSQPILLDEYGIHAMRNIGNLLVVLAGISGTVYRCDGANAYPIGQMPQDLSGGKYLEYYPGAITNYKNKVFFGVGQGGTTAIAGMGVYSLQQTGRGSILNFEHTISTLSDGSTNPLKPSAILPATQDTLIVAWRDNATYGIDLGSSTSYVYTTEYSGYFDTPLYEVGDNLNKWKPTSLEIRLGTPLRTGEGIRISYRTNLTDSFTTVKTLAFADNGVGAIQSKIFSVDIPDNIKQAEQIQMRVAFLGTSTTTPEFKSLKLM